MRAAARRFALAGEYSIPPVAPPVLLPMSSTVLDRPRFVLLLNCSQGALEQQYPPLCAASHSGTGTVSRLPLPGCDLRPRGESRSAGEALGRTRPAGPCRVELGPLHSGRRVTHEARTPGHVPGPHKRVWRPVLGRLTASQTHTLRTGSQSRAGGRFERSETGSAPLSEAIP